MTSTRFDRRLLSTSLAVGLTQVTGPRIVRADEVKPPRVKQQSVSFAQPDEQYAAYETVAYASPKGPEMFRIRSEEMKDDITSNFRFSRSSDHGETWGEEESFESTRQTPQGTYRRMFFNPPFCDPKSGRLLLVGEEGVLPKDSSLDAFAHSRQVYLTSNDQGRTWSKPRLVIHRGDEFSPEHVMPGIHFGKNASQMANCIYGRSDGAVIVPMQLSILKDGKLYLPPGAFTYLDSAMVIGRWQDDGSLTWEMGQRLSLPPEKSLRGVFEPTVAEFPGGRMLVVLRANDGHKWHAVSRDGGMTWHELRHWTYADGTPFYSPSSISILFTHTNGTRYWIGNICEGMPSGNSPRYPLVIGRVDPETLLLDRKSVATIDTRRDGDPPGLQLSNFNMVEDRRNGDILLRMTRWNGAGSGAGRKVSASVNLYRIEL